MKVKWKKSERFITVDIDGMTRQIYVTNLVRERRDEDPEDVQRTIPGGKPYKPKGFPIGEWKITGCSPKKSDYLYPFFISTNASQMV